MMALSFVNQFCLTDYMFRIALQIGLTVTAFLITASVSLAAECADDPNECTPKKLCEIATDTYGGDGNISWSAATSKAEHVTFAQGLGMTCGVIAALDPCDSDPNDCKISQLCGKATTENTGQVSWDNSAEAYVALAKEYGLSCDVSDEIIAEKFTADFKQAFKAEPKLRRQQIQYALKKLGFYSYGADGLWGDGTSTAFDKFVSSYDLENNSEVAVFRSLLSKVKVPSSFAIPPKKVAKTQLRQADQNGLFPEYACTTNKFDMNMSGNRVTTNEGMTAAMGSKPNGEKIEFSSKETREMIKEFNLDQSYSLKFSDNKVALVDPNLNAQKLSEALKDESPADRAKLTRVVENFFAPIKYKIDNNVASWSQKYPKEFELGSTTIAHSFNLKTQQYLATTRATVPYQIKMKTWASCDPS
jgi:hypothetical protein